MRTAFLLLLFTSLTACQLYPVDSGQEAVTGIAYGTSFGECVGYCRTELVLTEDRQTLQLISQHLPEQPAADKHAEARLPDTTWQRLASLLPFARFRTLDAVYGCPDCADGGAEWIEMTQKGRTHRVTFEYGHPPAPLAVLQAELRQLHDALRAQIEE